MSDPYFQSQFAERIGGKNFGKSQQLYKFEKIKRAKRQAISDFPDRPLLDFGVGENDEIAPEIVRAAMPAEMAKWENRGYADNGILEYKQAAAQFMQREFGVELDPQTEINHCIGSKSALAILPSCFINPGDVTLMTVPGYPVAGSHTTFLGGEVHRLPLLAEHDFLPRLDLISPQILARTKLLVLNYPNSPTGKLATIEFYQHVIEFARAHGIVVLQDAAHIMLSYKQKPLSFLSVPGAKEVGVELHSMSKGFNMIGWRLGFLAGNALIVRAFAELKDNFDSGQFIAIQKAACLALAEPSIPRQIRDKYERRLRKLVQALAPLGFKAQMPEGTYFLYTPAPTASGTGARFANAEEASHWLIREKSICSVPWDDAGAHLRFSVTYRAESEAAEDALMRELVMRLGDAAFSW
jgi:LL-diaminopimelate aminotransferase